MSNVIDLPVLTSLDLSPRKILNNIAEDENIDKVFVITWGKDNKMPEYYSNTSDMPCVIFRLMHFIHNVYNGEYGEK